jgi:uncharacterized membrane protein YcaP (DUF421 family)
MNLSPEQDKLTVNVILDGRILHYNLKYTGNDQIWLQKQLAAQGITDIANVFLATCDNKNSLSVYPKVNRAATQDIFE